MYYVILSEMGEWKVGSKGTGKRTWVVYRDHIRYASISGALRAANRLNSEAMTPIAVDAPLPVVAD